MSDVEPLPPGACDTHIHVYDRRFPASPDALLYPPDATPADYRRAQAELGLDRVVLVQPTTYGLDNRCQIEAAASFGADARLVVVVDDTTSREHLRDLDALGARGARFHMLPGGAVGWSALQPVAERIAELGWHIQLQLNGRELPARAAALDALPCPLVVDHIGRYMPPVPRDDFAFEALCRRLDAGDTWVKLSAPYEAAVDDTHRYGDVGELVRRLVDGWPERLLWATNWPHPGQTDPPDLATLRRLLDEWVPDARTRRTILVDNPAELYGFPR